MSSAVTPAPPAYQPGTHVPALDGLRGVAILLVLVFHFYSQPLVESTIAFDTFLRGAAGIGWAGVDLFFVLSGFLITGILLDAKSGGSYFRSFYGRRVLRIFPVYLGVLALLLFVLPLFSGWTSRENVEGLREHQAWYWTFTINWRTAMLPLDNIGTNAGHYWSLAVEEQFYIVWPAIVLLAGRRTLAGICAACIVTALVFRILLVNGTWETTFANYAPTVLTPARMDSLALGGLIALVAREPRLLASVARWAPAAALMAVAALVPIAFASRHESFVLFPFDMWVQTAGYSVIALLGGSLLLMALTTAPGKRMHAIATSPFLTTFGRYSYALYVVHLPIMFFLARRIGERGGFPLYFGSDALARAIFCFLGISLSLTIAWISWNLVEKQALKLKRFFPYGDERAAAEPARAEQPAAPGAATGDFEPAPATVSAT